MTNKSFVALSYETCDKYPDKIAVIDGVEKYTFSDVRFDSNRIASDILKVTQGASVPVVVLAESRYAGAVTVVALAKAGAYFTFVEPTQSVEYCKKVAGQMEATLIITTRQYREMAERIIPADASIILLDDLIGQGTCEDVNLDYPEDRVSYVVFTSGSTGEPKGIENTYAKLTSSHLEIVKRSNTTSVDVQSSTMSFSFGWGLPPIRYSLLSGCAISFFRFDQHTSLEAAEWINRDELTIVHMPSSFFHRFVSDLVEHPEIELPSLRLINSGGEKVRPESLRLFQKVKGLNCTVRDSLSSSETSTYFVKHYTKQMVIEDVNYFDEPWKNSQVFIRDADGRFATRSAVGEIAVHSDMIFSGYFKSPELNQDRFVPHPDDPTKRVFLTGDMGELNDKGHLRILGRADHMVKIRGYRMDLEEIRLEINKLPFIVDSAVIVTHNKRGDAHLGAYIVFQPEGSLPITDLKIALLEYLAPYKVPQFFMVLEQLPYGTAGKVDRSRLPAFSKERPLLRSAYLAPTYAAQKKMAAIWEEVLDISGIGIEDDFFELGGDSISVLEMITMLEKEFGSHDLSAFYERSTITQLSDVIAGKVEKASDRENYKKKAVNTRSKYFVAKNKWNLPLRFARGWLESKPYDQAMETLAKLSRNVFVREVIFARQKVWFNRWLKVTGTQGDPNAAFQKYVLADLTHYMSGFNRLVLRDHDLSEAEKMFKAGKLSESFITKLRNTPEHGEFEWLPMIGIERFYQALDRGKGVILVTLHGNVRIYTNIVLRQVAGLERILTVTHNAGKFGKYGEDTEEGEYHQISASSAMVADEAERMLRQGNVLQFFSDTTELRTKNYLAKVFGRDRQFKGGFAEMAVRSGAAIIPVVNVIDERDRVVKLFFPELTTEKEIFEEQVLDLVEQYARFLETVWREHPETQTFGKMKKYIRNIHK